MQRGAWQRATSAVRGAVVRSLGRWTESWDDLVAKAAVPTLFSRSWWLAAVAGLNTEFLLL